jgi:cell division septum initiation protein DivIVA
MDKSEREIRDLQTKVRRLEDALEELCRQLKRHDDPAIVTAARRASSRL